MTDAQSKSPVARTPAVRKPRPAQVLVDVIRQQRAHAMPVLCPLCGKKIGAISSAEALQQEFVCHHCKHEFELLIEDGHRMIVDRLDAVETTGGVG